MLKPIGLVLGLALVAWLTQADAQAPSITAQTVTGGGDPIWAPDGKRIAFGFAGHIYTMPTDGGEPTRLTAPKPNQTNREHAWSPDGVRIALVRSFVLGTPQTTTVGSGVIVTTTPSTRHIFVMSADGAEEKQLTSSGDNYFVQYSPDGRRLVFVSNRDGDRAVSIVNIDGAQERRVTPPSRGFDFGLRVSPDGQWIALASTRDGRRQIYTVQVDGSKFTRLTSAGENHSPTWSPDGRRIAYVSNRGDWHIYSMNADGTDQRRLTTADRNLDPVWSPDGKRIAFRVTVGDYIHVMSPDGSSPARLTTIGKVIGAPTWSPDGQRIAFAAAVPHPGGESAQIFIVNADGSELKRLTGP